MKTRFPLSMAGLLSLAIIYSCAPKPSEPSEDPVAKQEAANKENYKAILEAFNAFNAAMLDTLIAADGIDHDKDTVYK